MKLGDHGVIVSFPAGAGRERVVVSSASLTEYSTRSYMSLEGFRQEGSNEVSGKPWDFVVEELNQVESLTRIGVHQTTRPSATLRSFLKK